MVADLVLFEGLADFGEAGGDSGGLGGFLGGSAIAAAVLSPGSTFTPVGFESFFSAGESCFQESWKAFVSGLSNVAAAVPI